MRQDTRILPYGKAAIAAATALVHSGQPVAIATETVYGLAADATNGTAVAAIYAAKGRPSFNPLIVHVPDLTTAERFGVFDEAARALAGTHWPGPLTLVVPLRPDSAIASLATAGLPTIALRVPAHRAMRALLDATGLPLAAPSANASGGISPTRAEHVLQSLDGRVALIVDDGPCPVGIESTIMAATGDDLRLLRPGPIIIDAQYDSSGSIEAPGQLASHYAPSKPVRLGATSASQGTYFIGFGRVAGDETLSAQGNVVEAAAHLFDALHRADASAAIDIAVAPIPETGCGVAINDRLRRAAQGAR
jgi:L-threonylcarbamoyladenylate synthase